MTAPAREVATTAPKALKDRIFLLTVTPNTDPAQVAFDIAQRLGWSEGMSLRALWTSLSEPRVVSAVIRYEARGANANDLRRQVVRACPVAAGQIQVTEILTINRDIDPALIDAVLLGLGENQEEPAEDDG